MKDCALEINNVSKVYKLYDKRTDRLKEAFNPFRKKYHKKFYALNGVSFDVKKGEKIGIIGANGAGKSTLLKIITGVLNQTEGTINIDGKIAALLELGAGFNMDYTGIENIYLNGTLMGYSAEEMAEKAQKIIDFADIGDFINQPVKSYSSGMFVRLAFATQIFSEPDILIVDEALSVGDIRFQQKCFRAMESIMKDKTVILVTHDTAAVTRFCQRVVWINKGQKMYDGDVVEGLKQYQEFIINQAIEEKKVVGNNDFVTGEEVQEDLETISDVNIPETLSSIRPKGNGDAYIYRCGLFNENNENIDIVEPKQTVKFVVCIEYKKQIEKPILGLAIRDRLGNEIIGINTETLDKNLSCADGKMQYIISFKVPELNKGEYTVSIAVANGYQADHVQMCWIDDAIVFRIMDREHDIPGFIYIDEGNVEVYRIEK